MEHNKFAVVGIKETVEEPMVSSKKWYKGKPVVSITILLLILLGCLFCKVLMTKSPTYMDLAAYNTKPNREFLFGTDTMGRDIFSMVWYGGRVSLLIGFLATILSTFLAIVYGSFSGLANEKVDGLLMRLTEVLLSIPSLLLVILIQAVIGKASILSLSIVIGTTSWFSIAKVIRTEVRQLKGSEYVVASRCMGGGFFHILWRHLTPNYISSIMFMVVMNVRSAIIAESTLSFMGLGLPLEVISWGSMLSLSEKALLTGSWWILLIPGGFLVTTLVCITNIGNYIRISSNKSDSNL